MLYVGERFSEREVEEQDHQKNSKLAIERKVKWNFQRKENSFAGGRANIRYFPLYLNVSSEDNVSMENTSKSS